MMDQPQRRLLLGRIRALEDEARRLTREIFDAHEHDVREEKRLAESKSDLFFAALEDALYLTPTEGDADPRKVRILKVQERTNQFILQLAELERDRRSARHDREEAEMHLGILRARQTEEAMEAEHGLLGRVLHSEG
ncbi:MAG TPA: hypothetical protein VF615_25640 [Longimicrobiaceae bacterium]|jgi:hypothetical protein